ncbi:hypothetical protein VWM68_11135, partial [Campylobacter coli]
PKEIVKFLDDYVIGQKKAKKIIAIALRNRYRRMQLSPELQDDLNAHKDELSDCFMGARISVKDIVKTDLLKAQNETYVKILPLR